MSYLPYYTFLGFIIFVRSLWRGERSCVGSVRLSFCRVGTAGQSRGKDRQKEERNNAEEK